MKLTRFLLSILLLSQFLICNGQNHTESSLKDRLDSLSNSSIPQLNESVDLSLSNLPLSEFIRAVSNHVGLNVNISPNLTSIINNNYSGVKAKNIILMLCEQYNLKCSIYGNIINLQPKITNDKKCIVNYIKDSNLLSFELVNAPLSEFTQKLSELSDLNFFLLAEAKSAIVNGYSDSLNVIDALYGLAKSNNLNITEESENVILIEPNLEKNGESLKGENYGNLERYIKIDDLGQISVTGQKLPVNGLIQYVTERLNIPFQQLNPIKDIKSVSLNQVTFETFMNAMVAGTPNTYKFQNGVLHIAERNKQEMKTTQIIKFNYRRVDSLLNMLPKRFLSNFELNEFSELNSILITGDADQLMEAEQKLRELDVSVPVVLIDVIIINVSNTDELKTGIEAGLATDENPVTTGGTINPGIDYTMSASSVNSVISKLGLTKLGKVTPEFYVKLQALETNGVVDIRSTPQLSTLNGHPANLSIGEIQYYQERRNVYQGALDPQLETLTSYLPVKAQLGVTIEPFVTGNGDVTLSIEVEQSNFTDRFKEDAPPGLISRTFKSMIRVKNQEMVLLGGLEEIQNEKTRSGLPFFARIPIIRWLFTKTDKRNNKSKLNVFIKPTILY